VVDEQLRLGRRAEDGGDLVPRSPGLEGCAGGWAVLKERLW